MFLCNASFPLLNVTCLLEYIYIYIIGLECNIGVHTSEGSIIKKKLTTNTKLWFCKDKCAKGAAIYFWWDGWEKWVSDTEKGYPSTCNHEKSRIIYI